ncbi:MAG: YARHG domain-containing protein [Lachnospiraceae bacterium]|nr:YARHG domain-containing protein [Lachnospiraceae bacterium]
MRKKRNILKRNSGFVIGCVLAAGASFLTVDLVLSDVLSADLFTNKEQTEDNTEMETEPESVSVPDETEEARTYETDAFTVIASGSVTDGVETEADIEEGTAEDSEAESNSDAETNEDEDDAAYADSTGDGDTYYGDGTADGGSDTSYSDSTADGDSDAYYGDGTADDNSGDGWSSNDVNEGAASWSDGESDSSGGSSTGSTGSYDTGSSSTGDTGSYASGGASTGTAGTYGTDGSLAGNTGSGSTGSSTTGSTDTTGSDLSDTESDEPDTIISGISSRYISESELYGYSLEELRLIRNEIFALHGRMFKSEDLQEYFNQKSWYVPLYTPEEFDEDLFSHLNEYEKANLNVILAYEEALGG